MGADARRSSVTGRRRLGEQTALERGARGLGAVVHAELDEDVRDVADGGLLADDQPLGDASVGAALDDEREHLDLAGRQTLSADGLGPDEHGLQRVRLHWIAEAVEVEVGDAGRVDLALDRRVGATADQDLPRPRLLEQPCGEAHNEAGRLVVPAALEPHPPDRRVADGDAGREVEIVVAPPPARLRPWTSSRISVASTTACQAGASTGMGSLRNAIKPLYEKNPTVASLRWASAPTASWNSRRTPMTSSGAAVSETG